MNFEDYSYANLTKSFLKVARIPLAIFTKEVGEIKLRFRVIDGRDVQLYHKSGLWYWGKEY